MQSEQWFVCVACKQNKIFNMSNEKDRKTHKGHVSIYIDDLKEEVEENESCQNIRELSYKEVEE